MSRLSDAVNAARETAEEFREEQVREKDEVGDGSLIVNTMSADRAMEWADELASAIEQIVQSWES